MYDRLKIVLDALGYGQVNDLRYKSNLLHAIQIFALIQNDEAMESACDAEIEKIRQEVAQRQLKK